MKTMYKKSALAFCGVLVAFTGATAMAQAQDEYTPYNPTNPVAVPLEVEFGAPALPYTGPFSVSQPQVSNGPLGFGTANVQASTSSAANASTGGTGGGLAVTGSDVELPVAVGTALLAAGAAAVVASRKREANDE